LSAPVEKSGRARIVTRSPDAEGNDIIERIGCATDGGVLVMDLFGKGRHNTPSWKCIGVSLGCCWSYNGAGDDGCADEGKARNGG